LVAEEDDDGDGVVGVDVYAGRIRLQAMYAVRTVGRTLLQTMSGEVRVDLSRRWW
jgi:hypothetical protein